MSSSDTTDEAAVRDSVARRAWQPVALVLGAVASLLLVAVGALGLSGALGATNPGSPASKNPDDGVRLQAFDPALPRIGGGDLIAPWTTGRPGILLFFAHWCPPCRRELPGLRATIGTGDLDGVQILGIDEDTASVARSFVASEGLEFPVGIDGAEALAARLVPAGLPSAVLVNASGTVVNVRYGALSRSQLLGAVASLDKARDGRRLPSAR